MRPTPVQIFSRTPTVGRTKTRLIPAIGAEAAARLHRRLTRRTVEVACAAAVGPVTLWATPTSRHAFFDALRSEFGIALCDQVGADLGERMFHALSATTQAGTGCMVIGSDCPGIEIADLRLAATRVQDGRDAVLGPAFDGGYFLIAVRRAAPVLFADVAWGGDRVLHATRARLMQLRWTWSELPARADVDRPEDLARLGGSWLE